MALLHVKVVGVVQGVGFRWFVRERARRLGLSGWVKNLADGGVEVAASGNETQLDLLRAVLLRGPDGAVVRELQHQTGEPSDPLTEPFSILR
jgi:acylphosphatase